MCYGPIQVTNNGVVQTAPCGHCQRCARRRTMSWTLRLLLERCEHELSDFVTLTYGPGMVPETLDVTHFEAFIKRLRRSTPNRVRFFCCGEYGGKTRRPHWHVLLFGHRLPERGLFHIAQWPHGHVFTGEIEAASAQYVCRYTLKSSGAEKPQIIRMSRRPGIGMTSLRTIAQKVAQKVPDMAYFPPVVSAFKKHWWLDRRAYAACVDAYLNAGGALSYDSPPPSQIMDWSVRSLPIDHAVREWGRMTNGKI